jgi:hypothetical protein
MEIKVKTEAIELAISQRLPNENEELLKKETLSN